MTTTNTTTTPSTTYAALVAAFELRPIRDDARHAKALEVVDALAAKPEESLTADQVDYLAVLGDLVSAYERAADGVVAKASGLDVLRHLLEENSMSASDLGRVLGHRELGSKILAGDRQISRSHAVKLAARFGLPAETFLRPAPVAVTA